MMSKMVSCILGKSVTLKMFFTYINQKIESFKKDHNLQHLTEFTIRPSSLMVKIL